MFKVVLKTLTEEIKTLEMPKKKREFPLNLTLLTEDQEPAEEKKFKNKELAVTIGELIKMKKEKIWSKMEKMSLSKKKRKKLFKLLKNTLPTKTR
jgi:hypothetical protein